MKVIEENKKFKSMKTEELAKELDHIQKKATLELLSVKAGKSSDSAKVNRLRKTVARIKTIMGEKQGAAND